MTVPASLLAGNGGDGSAGFVLTGIDSSDYAGIAVSGAGDINGDGVADVVIGAYGADPGGRNSAGESYVVFGRADTDGDGLHDAADNCIQVANAEQRDTDADGFGNVCDADLNNDCAVNLSDLGLMKSVFFSSDADADLNGDGSVNFFDLGIMKAGFFAEPGPSGVQSCAMRTSAHRGPAGRGF